MSAFVNAIVRCPLSEIFLVDLPAQIFLFKTADPHSLCFNLSSTRSNKTCPAISDCLNTTKLLLVRTLAISSVKKIPVPFYEMVLPLSNVRLRSGPKVHIAWRATAQSPAVRIYESFPADALAAFSKRFREELKDPKRIAVVFVGCKEPALISVLNWILTCCHKYRVVEFPTPTTHPFYRFTRIKEAAEYLQIPVLVESIDAHLNRIASVQVHSQDVIEVYNNYPAGHYYRFVVADSIAGAWWEGRLRAIRVYEDLRKVFADFDEDVQSRLDHMNEVGWGKPVPTSGISGANQGK